MPALPRRTDGHGNSVSDQPNQKLVWITGAGKGIGRAIAVNMSARGWRVAASARTEKDLQSLQAEAAGDVYLYPLDVTDEQASRGTIEAIERDVGKIELAILNAGSHNAEPGISLSVENTRKLMEVNFMGTIHGISPLIERFVARKSGHIAVVASLAGYRGLPTAAAYGASKAALINLCESLRPELEAAGVTLSMINPGFVETPLTDKNEFDMPFLMPADKAADVIVRGLEDRRFEISMPTRFALIMKLLRILPSPLFFALTRRMIGS